MKAVFDNKNGILYPNQFVNAKVEVDTLRDQIVVPTVAVQNGQQGTFVYVVQEGENGTATVHLRPVQVLSSDQTGAVIKSGLKAGDRVAVDGSDRVQDGGTVRVRLPGEAEAEAAADAAAVSGRGGRGARGGRGGRKGGTPGGTPGAAPGGAAPGGNGGRRDSGQ